MRDRSRVLTVFVVLALSLAASACSDPAPSPSAKGPGGDKESHEKRGKKDAGSSGHDSKKKGSGHHSSSGEGDAGGSGADGKSSSSGPNGSGSDKGDDRSGGGDGGPGGDGPKHEKDPSRGYAARGDADSDAESHGDVPLYAEITRATVEGLGQNVRLTMTFAANVPQAMPDNNTFFNAGFRFDGPEDDDPYVYADADDQGWKPSTKSGNYPGSFSVTGPKIVFELPWSALGGARSFKWYGNDSWVNSGLVTTSYSFDEVPNIERANYP